ncbi:hypothetical protein IEQ11_25190 [Lysobacter capsici]|uniref:hypothetical protein n=1 Tax=Lysobacter capsici TaxID=435897 RepID=UPI001786BCA9|nr:hypothetical protein [Lysobacter capsici]UOF14965.1 hypothetical protein IEQ11_25190 [Lysobacter capsici]
MTIDPELQSKIDALEDEKLKARILRALTSSGKKQATDEEIYKLILSSYTKAKEQRARLRQWRDDEVAAFAQYFKQKRPEEYIEFLRQEKEFNEIESGLAWGVRQLIWEWIPNLDGSDCTALFSKFRDYAKLDLA